MQSLQPFLIRCTINKLGLGTSTNDPSRLKLTVKIQNNGPRDNHPNPLITGIPGSAIGRVHIQYIYVHLPMRWPCMGLMIVKMFFLQLQLALGHKAWSRMSTGPEHGCAGNSHLRIINVQIDICTCAAHITWSSISVKFIFVCCT